MRKACIIPITLLAGFFLFQETTVSPIIKIQAQTVDQQSVPSQPISQVTSVNVMDTFAQRADSVLLDAPVVRQMPELYNGCEVTSLAMLLAASGRPVDKMELAQKVKKDPTPFKGTSLQKIQEWGDPNQGFVGDITGKKKGYGVYNGPLFELLKEYVSVGAVNLTGKDFASLEWVLSQGNPVVVWTTVSYQPTERWVSWKKDDQAIKATFQLHAVLLVGYDENYVYINDPLPGSKAAKVPKSSFIESWKQLGSQAVTIVDHEHWYVLNR
ncbi:C39 family peptidase [Ammoniphilus sp. CFH 90114]|uniref:C39 family peptidase n=1 Tax=Ammoniphilus sp. CFH 90114 TaxID=2493665 RepID=UPI0013E93275|nr:C39 family peptidase [Ammoniphilus sp. CFH 90114]